MNKFIDFKDKKNLAVLLAVALVAIVLLFNAFNQNSGNNQNFGEADDWQFSPMNNNYDSGIIYLMPVLVVIGVILALILGVFVYLIIKKKFKLLVVLVIGVIVLLFIGGVLIVILTSLAGPGMSSNALNRYSSEYNSLLGYSVGGAKDIGNFRENIDKNYLPVPTDITFEGLFYDYFFDTGETEACNNLFCPSYTYAVSKDPFSQKDEYFLSVGLNSNIKESDFKRKKLNLVVVLDISGSMSSGFDSYYYDQFGNKVEVEEDSGKTKMQIANESVVALLDHLNEDDKFGMVLFDNSGYIGKPLSRVGNTDMEAIKGHILELSPQGGTNFEAGYRLGTSLFDSVLDSDQGEYENRIIFLTDAMPNIGMTSKEGLFGLTSSNAEKKVHTTFIGIGVDFGTELIEAITKIRGSNYYSVHSSKEFKTRMDDEFEFMVTPLVFNLLLDLDAKGYEIEKVYGSPEADEATGEIMKVNTLFPSAKKETETRGGIILLKLKKTSQNEGTLNLSVSYEDRQGNKSVNKKTAELKENQADYYDNTGIRKAILLSRYASLMKNWIKDEAQSISEKKPVYSVVGTDSGIPVPEELTQTQLGIWERQSVPLAVSDEYKQIFSEFKEYFEAEMNEIDDESLSKEVDILNKLRTYQG
ncbi:VWA domain-containing protein [Candidatus Micrarchaeota archaeon]|nr:VWA domain-containing protein [Candidatus Micrarchaeota archaeon]MBU2477183.1 VWA domain-containing protein [Candidatus Micrarchaeota archaeon]